MQHIQDPIIQQLFGIAEDIFGTDIEEYENLLVYYSKSVTKQTLSFPRQTKDCWKMLRTLNQGKGRPNV